MCLSPFVKQSQELSLSSWVWANCMVSY